MDRKLFERSLSPFSTAQEQIHGLKEAGFTVIAISKAVNRSPQAMRGIANQGASPRKDTKFRLNALRNGVSHMVDSGVEPTDVVNWLEALHDETTWPPAKENDPPYAIPLDTMAADPTLFLSTIRSQFRPESGE